MGIRFNGKIVADTAAPISDWDVRGPKINSGGCKIIALSCLSLIAAFRSVRSLHLLPIAAQGRRRRSPSTGTENEDEDDEDEDEDDSGE